MFLSQQMAVQMALTDIEVCFDMYCQIAKANVTLPKGVLNTVKTFAVYI